MVPACLTPVHRKPVYRLGRAMPPGQERPLQCTTTMFDVQEIDAVIDALDVDTDTASFLEEEDTATVDPQADAFGTVDAAARPRARTEPEASVIVDPGYLKR